MAQTIAAFSSIVGTEGQAPAYERTPEEAVAQIMEIIGTEPGKELNDDEYATVWDCLLSIGTAETSEAEDDSSLQGKGSVSFPLSCVGLQAEATCDFAVENVWDRSRRQWCLNMGVKKTGGEAHATKFVYKFRFVSFGTSDVTEAPVVMYNTGYERIYDDYKTCDNFEAGKTIYASEFDISGYYQWGYLAFATCEISTDSQPPRPRIM